MTTGQWGASIGEAQGAVAPPADVDKYAVVLGCTSSGNTGLRGPFLSAAAIVAACGYGDTCDTAGQICEQVQRGGGQVPRVPVCVYELPAATLGSYGTIDITGVTGTCRPAVDGGAPFGTYRAAAQIVTGGTVGTAGITYRVSTEEDPDWTSIAPRRLGTATTIAIANTGCGFVLAPASAAVTALYAKLNTFKGVMSGTGHFVIVSGSPAVHASADITDDTALAAVPDADTPAKAVTMFNACLSLLGTHGASATYHTGADTALATALAAIPTAVNVADVDLYLDNLIAAYTAHIANTTGVHGSADSTNTITAYTSAPGTLVAGNVFFVYTKAPQPDVSGLDAAYVALGRAQKQFGLAVHEFDLTPTLATHIGTGLTNASITNRQMVALAHTDMPDLETSETESAWADSVETAFALGTVDDSRIVLWSSYVRETDARTSAVWRRSGFAQFCADVVRVAINEVPCAPADQAASGLTIWTSDDVQVGHDEGPMGTVTGLSNADLGNRFVSTVAALDVNRGRAVYYTVPWTLAAATDNVKTLPMRRVATSMKRAAFSAAYGLTGLNLDYTPPDPDAPGSGYLLTAASRAKLHAVIFGAVSEPYAGMIQNADDADLDTGLVWINPSIAVRAGKVIDATYELRVQFEGVLMTITGSLVVKE